MNFKIVFSLLFIVVAVSLLSFYWFIPVSDTYFFMQNQNQEFNFENDTAPIQFYENMRFSESKISYKIEDCPLAKKDEMLRAFEVLSDATLLSFYVVNSNEEITITCDSRTKIEGGLFIAGEGGPTNITKAGEFNVITRGKILLIRESNCENPNIPIHELLHVLGFNHAENPKDIMYSISKCGQEISPATIDLINNLYSIPSYPDLQFEGISANMHGKYLNINLSIRNNGLSDSPDFKIKIYADDTLVKEIDAEELKIGHGRMISLSNVWINQLSVKKIELEIVSPFNELKKENNKALLEVKK